MVIKEYQNPYKRAILFIEDFQLTSRYRISYIWSPLFFDSGKNLVKRCPYKDLIIEGWKIWIRIYAEHGIEAAFTRKTRMPLRLALKSQEIWKPICWQPPPACHRKVMQDGHCASRQNTVWKTISRVFLYFSIFTCAIPWSVIR